MVEIITREFIQMGGSAGEVRTLTTLASFDAEKRKAKPLDFPIPCTDGAGESQNSAKVHVDDESRVSSCYI